MTLNKKEFLEKMKQQYDELNDKWNLERKKYEEIAQHATVDVLKKLEAEWEELRKLRNQMKEKIIDLEVAGENAWDDVRVGSETAWKALSESFAKAVSRFK